MIVRLRREFIAVNMALVSVVLVAVLAVHVFSSYQFATDQVMLAGKQALEWAEHSSAPRFEFAPRHEGEPPPEQSVGWRGGRGAVGFLPVFSVEVDENWAVIALQTGPGITVTVENAQTLANQVQTQSAGYGDLPGQELSYLSCSGADGHCYIAFVDNTAVTSALREDLLVSLLILAVTLPVFFLISRFLAGKAVGPIQLAWEQQRQFVADASHELKTPLTVAMSNVDMALSSGVPTFSEKNSRRLVIAQTELKHMKALVEQLLVLARADAAQEKRQARVTEQIDLSHLAEVCVSSFEPVFFEAGKTLVCQIEAGCMVRGVSEELAETVRVLLDNARKYAAPASTASLLLAREDRSRVHLRVESDGPPIPPEKLERIFDRFYRADESRGEISGYGLGLSIAREIAVRHRGELWAESDANGHTVFHFRLPAVRR